MVRLVSTDFVSLEQNKEFYAIDEYSSLQKMFTYERFKIHEVYLEKTIKNESIYSLNLLSNKHLKFNEFLVYISQSEYYILFNHKTSYCAKISNDFFMDDIIKAILITKHISKLASPDENKTINLLLNTQNNTLLKKLFEENIKKSEQAIHISNLENINTLIKELNPLITSNNFVFRSVYFLSVSFFVFWFLGSGINILETNLITKHSLKSINKSLYIEQQSIKRNTKTLLSYQNEYKNISMCLNKKEIHVSH